MTNIANTARHDRNSTFELLRIIAMLMIVFCHFANDGGLNYTRGAGIANRVWCRFILMGGARGNALFVLLSGYFLITSKGINWRRLFNLWCRMFFYPVMFFSIFVITGSKHVSNDILGVLLRPVSAVTYPFASRYFMLYLFHPLLNMFLTRLTREEYRRCIIHLTLCLSISTVIPGLSFDLIGHLPIFVYYYILAGYVRLWINDDGGKKYIFYGIALIALNFFLTILTELINLKDLPYILIESAFGLMLHGEYGMLSPLNVAATICFLIGFKSIRIPSSKIINTLASATFGVYLIHCNTMFAPVLWKTVFRFAPYYGSIYIIPYSFLVTFIIYFSCSFVELVRSKIFMVFSLGRLS